MAAKVDEHDGGLQVHTFYLGCLAQASYVLIDKTSRAAYVIDPRRDVACYMQVSTASL